MTLEERIKDAEERLHRLSGGAHWRWNEETKRHEPIPTEEIRARFIRFCIEAGRQDGAEAEREACRKAVRSVADELHPERDHVKWSQWTSAIEEAEKRIRARSES